MSLITSYKYPNEQMWGDSMYKTGMAGTAVKEWRDIPDANLNFSVIVEPSYRVIKYGILNEKVIISGLFEVTTPPPNNELTAFLSLPYKVKVGEGGSASLAEVRQGYTIDTSQVKGLFQHVLQQTGIMYWFSWDAASGPNGSMTCNLYSEGIIDGETIPFVFP